MASLALNRNTSVSDIKKMVNAQKQQASQSNRTILFLRWPYTIALFSLSLKGWGKFGSWYFFGRLDSTQKPSSPLALQPNSCEVRFNDSENSKIGFDCARHVIALNDIIKVGWLPWLLLWSTTSPLGVSRLASKGSRKEGCWRRGGQRDPFTWPVTTMIQYWSPNRGGRQNKCASMILSFSTCLLLLHKWTMSIVQ